MSDMQGPPKSMDQRADARIRTSPHTAGPIGECFKKFRLATYPTATPVVTEAMRRCFFAGASDIVSLLQTRLAQDPDLGDNEAKKLKQWLEEISASLEQEDQTLRHPEDRTVVHRSVTIHNIER